jgi:hypothetical protein
LRNDPSELATNNLGLAEFALGRVKVDKGVGVDEVALKVEDTHRSSHSFRKPSSEKEKRGNR